MTFDGAKVRVLRSYDYCHFEVELGADGPQDIDSVNLLRKAAAALADEGVRQYKLAKAAERKREAKEYEAEAFLQRQRRIKEKPESEWSAEEAALMRGAADAQFWAPEERWDYGEDDDREYHFSMLPRFKKVLVR